MADLSSDSETLDIIGKSKPPNLLSQVNSLHNIVNIILNYCLQPWNICKSEVPLTVPIGFNFTTEKRALERKMVNSNNTKQTQVEPVTIFIFTIFI